jgi:hypothetical protein
MWSQKTLNSMVAVFLKFNSLSIYSWMELWFVNVVSKYVNSATLSNDLVNLYGFSCFLMTSYEHILSFLNICFKINFLTSVCVMLPHVHYQYRPEANVAHSIFILPSFLEPYNSFSGAKLKRNGAKAAPCFKPHLIGNVSDKCLSIWL